MRLSMFENTGLPLKFWPYSFTCTTYLMKVLPTSNNLAKPPQEVLFDKIAYYKALKVFGCTCFPIMRPCRTHKLCFRSEICVFLGYSANNKGYLCLNPKSGQIVISRDVIFHDFSTTIRIGNNNNNEIVICSYATNPLFVVQLGVNLSQDRLGFNSR